MKTSRTSKRSVVSKKRTSTVKRKRRLFRMEVGTSGFMSSQKQWLNLPMLNCIEVNSTFYRLIGKTSVEKYLKFPDRVSFIFKVSRFITHIKRLNDVKEAWSNFWTPLEPLASRIVTVLFQMPPSFHNKPVNVERIRSLKDILPAGLIPAFEFRDKSWLNQETYDLFKELGWCMVGTYILKEEGAKWMGTMPSGLFIPPIFGNMTYVRIHGRRGFRGAIDSEKLERLRRHILQQRSFTNICMFNNVFFDKRGTTCDVGNEVVRYAALCNACQFAQIKK